MQRTTIMLPGELRHQAMRQAQRLGISLGELIRKSLQGILKSKTVAELDTLFADWAVYEGKAPKDLAKNHDDYLYEEDA